MRFHPPLLVESSAPQLPLAARPSWDDLLEVPSYPALPTEPVAAEAKSAASGLARTIKEALMGLRDPHQLARWLSNDECEQIAAWARSHRGAQVRLRKYRLITVWPGNVEGYLHFDTTSSVLCAALRLGLATDRWRCLKLGVLLPGCGTVTSRQTRLPQLG